MRPWRHEAPGWVEAFLDHVTSRGRQKGPDSLSVHHYIGGVKARYTRCGNAVDYSDEAYYFTLDCLATSQKDTDLHRSYIREHTSPRHRTAICFDESGLWHPEASQETDTRQPQMMRDALFAANACDAIAPDDVRHQNTFDTPEANRSSGFGVGPAGIIDLPPFHWAAAGGASALRGSLTLPSGRPYAPAMRASMEATGAPAAELRCSA